MLHVSATMVSHTHRCQEELAKSHLAPRRSFSHPRGAALDPRVALVRSGKSNSVSAAVSNVTRSPVTTCLFFFLPKIKGLFISYSCLYSFSQFLSF